jgi:hypothetical protein
MLDHTQTKDSTLHQIRNVPQGNSRFAYLRRTLFSLALATVTAERRRVAKSEASKVNFINEI